MQVHTRTISILLITAALGLSAAALQTSKGQEPRAGEKPASAGQAEGGMPGVMAAPEHALLGKDVGVWDATIQSSMDPSGPQTSKGVETNRMLGETWLISDFVGEFGGMPFIGHGVTGYDTGKKKFTSFWVDNMGDQAALGEGTYDEASRKLTFKSKANMMGQAVVMTNVSEYKDEDTRVFTMSMAGPDGKDATAMTIEYKRRK